MTSREVPKRMTLSREADSRESRLSIEVTPSGSDAAIKITVPPIDDETPEFARGDNDDEPTAITSMIGPRLTQLPARVHSSRMTMSPVASNGDRPSGDRPGGERPSGERITISPVGRDPTATLVASDATAKKGGA